MCTLKNKQWLLLLSCILAMNSSIASSPHSKKCSKNSPNTQTKNEYAHLFPSISTEDAQRIGKQIWRNECGSSYDKLIWWNEGEEFASVGIGHFIWFPQSCRSPFTETFPDLLNFMKQKHIKIPVWLNKPNPRCPWSERCQVVNGTDPRLEELRTFLHTTIDLQIEFIQARSEEKLKKIISVTSPKQQPIIKKKIKLITATPQGVYALIDYINFKGEGNNLGERYKGEGWGLLQVLMAMDHTITQTNACTAFAAAAEEILTQRVRNAPPERNEQRWLPGWLNRLKTYRT